jgi:hypothetical protein
MENHLAVDEAMHGPRSPIYPHMQDITTRLDDMYPQDAGDERHSSLAELVVETSLDGVVSEQEKGLILRSSVLNPTWIQTGSHIFSVRSSSEGRSCSCGPSNC